MKKLLIAAIPLFLLASCASKQPPLYSWGKYDSASYNYLKNSNEKSTKELIDTYQKIIKTQKGSRKTVPPGIYADYGYLLIQSNKIKEGKAALMTEIKLYPESKIFVDRILKLVE